jgi:hypothetical protein
MISYIGRRFVQLVKGSRGRYRDVGNDNPSPSIIKMHLERKSSATTTTIFLTGPKTSAETRVPQRGKFGANILEPAEQRLP